MVADFGEGQAGGDLRDERVIDREGDEKRWGVELNAVKEEGGWWVGDGDVEELCF